ncbi:5-(carboxyamino)imidazole ribonucleotide synthase [Sphingomonas sp. BN140010]|uniref:N5-carboxyaminoimidazole ribonucleotide synthase n=1 Tax=Sphingomonas arvum TaxID=2992113 RepID=A0ABT3JB26_9SPHN|nr:5-(carboxyamino)imidazole ribonucleotide synthase [Sphingomonas sp. BN140010]MCW3796278.1 5-(carboxyamino)imidazole ribonucleotide synthase [Sphingomonas sp. BN140010]
MIPPGATIGIIGGGQLGRMLSVAAAQLGYRCHIFDPHERPCAADVAAEFTRGAFDDAAALERFAAACDVVTYEFENLAVEPLAGLAGTLRPGARSLAVAQDRAEEKRFIEASGAPVAPWRAVESLAEVEAAVAELGCPLVLKTRRYGYDGKGQAWVREPGEAAAAWAAIGEQPAVAERGISFEAEFSVIMARGLHGDTAFFDLPENRHEGGILRRSLVPAGPEVKRHAAAARRMAQGIADALEHVGVLTVEFFACADAPIVNEIAPRVHNSGHWTIEGAATSQFEQHVRAICELPLGSTALRGAGAQMDNLIGADVDRWPELVSEPGAALHLYGKGEARPGRKMGHCTRVRV